MDSAVFDGEAGGEEAASERRRMCSFWRAPDRDGIVFGFDRMRLYWADEIEPRVVIEDLKTATQQILWE